MRRLALLLAAVTACDPGLPPPSRVRAPVAVRVATWNVHDLFDAEDRLLPPGQDDLVPSPAEVEAKLTRVAAVLVRLDADLVLLQEVENRAILGRLASLAGYGAARLVEGGDPRGIDVAALSRLPIHAYASHLEDVAPDGGRLWPRDCVEVHADVVGRRLIAVASHFSSAVSDDGTRRAWQAARMRELADGLAREDPLALVLAGGDLNDAPGSDALAPLLSDGAWQDLLPAGDATWSGASAEARLDYLLVRADAPAVLRVAWVDAGGEVALASDHRPVVLELLLP